MHNYVVTWFPTRMNTTPQPPDTVQSTLQGFVTLNLSNTPFGAIANNYLDTLNIDHAFIIAPQQILRSMLAHEPDTLLPVRPDWDFVLYPNPANDAVTLGLPMDAIPRDIDIFDITGKQVFNRPSVITPLLGFNTGGWSKGTYGVRVSAAGRTKMKILILQ